MSTEKKENRHGSDKGVAQMEGIDQTQDKYVVILGSAPSEMHLLTQTLSEALEESLSLLKRKK